MNLSTWDAAAHFERPAWLWLGLLALLPLLLRPRLRSGLAWLGDVPVDPWSTAFDVGLRLLGVLAVLALAVGAAGWFRGGQLVEKISTGAHIALLIDRSGSMNDSFAGRTPAGQELAKAVAAKQLLKGFAQRREHDRIGVVAFSTTPIFVLPLTDRRDAVEAAINAIDRPGLSYTDVGRGLAMTLSLFDEGGDVNASRVVVLVSDGAAVIDPKVQAHLRAALAARPVKLYWLFLRTAGSAGIYDKPLDPENDRPQVMPERHLNLFFRSLGVPYRAFEADSPAAVAAAIDEIDKHERAELRYRERSAREPMGALVFGVAAVALLAMLLAKLAEVRVGAYSVDRYAGLGSVGADRSGDSRSGSVLSAAGQSAGGYPVRDIGRGGQA